MENIARWLSRKTVFRREWTLGIYRGSSPLQLEPYTHNPVLSSRDFSVPVRFLADPFLFRLNDIFYLFFEILNLISRRGEIAAAVSSDGLHWKVLGVVLAEPHHLSFPLVFAHQDHIYMLPESHKAKSVQLYRAVDFPMRWEPAEILLSGESYNDSVLLHHHQRWWLFTTTDNHHLRLFSAEDLLQGPWTEHPQSPVYTGLYARPAGKVLVDGQSLFRFAQNPVPEYGTSIIAFQVQVLSESEYIEVPLPDPPFLGPTGQGWNEKRMHHIDFLPLPSGQWLAAADGYSHALDTRWAVYPHKIRDRYLQSKGR